jgi:membrane protease YdiL (CAAX protease family)
LKFSFTGNASVKSILLFFFSLLIQIIFLAGILIFAFQINLTDVLNQKNIPEPAKYLYLGFLYIFMLLDLYLFDRRNFLAAFYGSRDRLLYFAKGFAAAFFSLLFLYILEAGLGFIAVRPFMPDLMLLGQVAIFSLIIALVEELLFRNFIFRKLREAYSLNTALIISGYIYGQLHFLKFGLKLSEIILPLTGLFFIGVILAYTFHTRDLWFSIGMHTAWIILITYTTRESLFILNSDYNLLTGGYYPIAGLGGIIMSVILLFKLQDQGNSLLK